jgi:hypothetical protein
MVLNSSNIEPIRFVAIERTSVIGITHDKNAR